MYKGNEGKCFGRWEPKDSACMKCLVFVRAKCERLTIRKKAESEGELIEAALSVTERIKDVNEYFFGILDARIDKPRVKWGEEVVTHFYYSSSGELVVFIACDRKTGKLKVRNSKLSKVVSLETTEQADELLKEILD